jgi:hypothetical protein
MNAVEGGKVFFLLGAEKFDVIIAVFVYPMVVWAFSLFNIAKEEDFTIISPFSLTVAIHLFFKLDLLLFLNILIDSRLLRTIELLGEEKELKILFLP